MYYYSENFTALIEDTIKKVLDQGSKSVMYYDEEGQYTTDPSQAYDLNDVVCAYRGANGNKCFVGHMIKDEFYSKDLEDRNIYSVEVKNSIKKSHPDILFADMELQLLSEFQNIHDGYDVRNWEKAFGDYIEYFRSTQNDAHS